MQLLIGNYNTTIEHKQIEVNSVKAWLGLEPKIQKETSVKVSSIARDIEAKENGFIRIIGNPESGRAVYAAELIGQALAYDASVIIVDLERPAESIHQLSGKGRLFDRLAISNKSDKFSILRDRIGIDEIGSVLKNNEVIQFALTGSYFYIPEGIAIVSRVIRDINQVLMNRDDKDAPVMIVFNAIEEFCHNNPDTILALNELKERAKDKGVYIVVSDLDVSYQDRDTELGYVPAPDEIFVYKKCGAYLNRLKLSGYQPERLELGECYIHTLSTGLVKGHFSYSDHKVTDQSTLKSIEDLKNRFPINT